MWHAYASAFIAYIMYIIILYIIRILYIIWIQQNIYVTYKFEFIRNPLVHPLVWSFKYILMLPSKLSNCKNQVKNGIKSVCWNSVSEWEQSYALLWFIGNVNDWIIAAMHKCVCIRKVICETYIESEREKRMMRAYKMMKVKVRMRKTRMNVMMVRWKKFP